VSDDKLGEAEFGCELGRGLRKHSLPLEPRFMMTSAKTLLMKCDVGKK
jgi:hypothetical protein